MSAFFCTHSFAKTPQAHTSRPRHNVTDLSAWHSFQMLLGFWRGTGNLCVNVFISGYNTPEWKPWPVIRRGGALRLIGNDLSPSPHHFRNSTLLRATSERRNTTSGPTVFMLSIR